MRPARLIGIGNPEARIPGARRFGRVRVVLGAAILAGVASAASGLLVAAAVLLLPSLLVLIAETSRGRPATRTTALFGLAAATPDLLAVLQVGAGWNAGWGPALDPNAVLMAWLAQGAGWLLTEVFPFLLAVLAERHAAATLRDLRASRAALVAEWAHLPADPAPASASAGQAVNGPP